MKDSEVYGEICRWLADVTNIAVIQAHQDGQRPALPYIMVNMTGVDDVRAHPRDFEYSSEVAPNDITATPVVDTQWQFSIHAFGTEPTDILRPVRAHQHVRRVETVLSPLLDLHKFSQIRSVPDYVNNKWEPRAQMDLTVHGLVRDGVLVQPIETTTPTEFTRTN